MWISYPNEQLKPWTLLKGTSRPAHLTFANSATHHSFDPNLNTHPQSGIIPFNAISTKLNQSSAEPQDTYAETTDKPPALHLCYRDSLWTPCNNGAPEIESGCYTAYETAWSQFHLTTCNRLQFLPDDISPDTCKSSATPVCTARRSSQQQSDYGTYCLQTSATYHQTASSRSSLASTCSKMLLRFYRSALHGFIIDSMCSILHYVLGTRFRTHGATLLSIELVPWRRRRRQSYKSHPQLEVQAETSSNRSSQVLDGSPNNSDLEQSSRRCRGSRLPWHFQEPAVCAPIVILGHSGVMSSALCRDSTRTRTRAHTLQNEYHYVIWVSRVGR